MLIIRALQASADSREQAIAGYYQGLYSVRTKGMYEDTKRYVANVLGHLRPPLTESGTRLTAGPAAAGLHGMRSRLPVNCPP